MAQSEFEAAPGSRELSQEEVSQVLDYAVSTQRSLEALIGVFRVTYHENTSSLSEEFLAIHPERAINGGLVTGTMKWWRNSAVQRLDITHDIPRTQMRGDYEDRVLYHDGEKQLFVFTRTQQGVLMPPGNFNDRGPEFWLLPGHKRGFAAFREAARFQFDGFEEPSGRVIIKVMKESRLVLGARLSPELDHAVIQWWTEGGKSNCVINYHRDPQGRVVPSNADFRALTSEGVTMRQWELEVVSITLGPPAESFEFTPAPRSLITDYRQTQNGEATRSYEVVYSSQFLGIPL